MIYLDNAATTHIKPYTVARAVAAWTRELSANPGRGGHDLSINAGNKVYECRELISKLFNIQRPENIIFTLNTTMALNIAINGFVKPHSHVVISGMEHNSVYRPIVAKGCRYTIAKPDNTGLVTLKSIKEAVRDNTDLIILTHASNVVGTINPITEIGTFAKDKGIAFLVDAAQTAGVMGIDVVRDNISMLAFAGHKMLFGPMGTGGLYVAPGIELSPFIHGGTGSVSESAVQPDFLPDRFESGTLNVPGIAGLAEGVRFILKTTPDTIRQKEAELTNMLSERLSNMEKIKIYGNQNRVGIVSFAVDGLDSVTVCNMLNNYNIASRGGLHCAPLAHQSLGTKEGLARLSTSFFNTKTDILHATDAIYKITKQYK